MAQYGIVIATKEPLSAAFADWPDEHKHTARAAMLYSLWFNGHPLPQTLEGLNMRIVVETGMPLHPRGEYGNSVKIVAP